METGLPSLPQFFFLYLTPIAAGAMLVRLFLNSETAIIFAIISSILSGLFLGSSLDITIFFLIGGVVAAMEVRHCIQRSTILKAGIILGIINALVIVGITILQGNLFTREILFTLPAGFAGGIITAVIVTGLTPIFELAFGYTTNITLLELSRMDHPLLKELALKAPGTYHHSLVIGSLVEAAATSINANPLLARVSAYYHDIGKTKMPLYFIENMKGENKHDKLTPSMSSLILINHVKEGGEMALEYRLGDEIRNVIQQHHGTTLIKYFYGKAKEQEDPEVQQIKEKDFRYPGPKPQTKEAGLVMLADAIEAASKTLPDPTTAKIKGMVQKIINRIFTDGQLDECELTLRDLNAIAKSFNRVLDGIFHQRIEYPEPAYITKEDTVERTAPQSPEETDRNEEDQGASKKGIRRLGA
jgi:putative nucleotidyltransferase with HDIG domain